MFLKNRKLEAKILDVNFLLVVSYWLNIPILCTSLSFIPFGRLFYNQQMCHFNYLCISALLLYYNNSILLFL